MCGITAVFGREITENDLYSILNVVARRGPEETCTARVNHGFMGHAALKFVDIANSKQPFVDHALGAIVYNGEIYNWEELNRRHDLGARNDTQTLLRGLARFGTNFLKEIDGQFAFIAQLTSYPDARTLIGRDKWGICPLVFGHNTKGQLCIASTPEALERGGVRRVKTVPAGAYGTVHGGEIALAYWWKLPRPDIAHMRSKDPRDVLAHAHRRVLARIPVVRESLYTAMGGIDSQFITVAVARHTQGRFGGAVTVVPWNPRDPDKLVHGDLPHARAAREMLRREGIALEHHVVQLTPEHVDRNLDRLAKLLGPDLFNLSCALAEDLVSATVERLGGKAIMTAGGPDEAGRSYRNWTLTHRHQDPEQVWYEMGEQFAYSEGVRAGLVLGEHGLENRVPLADLIELAGEMPAEDKQRVYDYGDGVNPETVKMDAKLFWRRAVRGFLPQISLSTAKETIHGATGAKTALLHVAHNDRRYQAERGDFARRAHRRQWGGIVLGNLAALDPRNPITECQLYALYRWSKVEAELFDLGGAHRYGPYLNGVPRFGHQIEERVNKPLCYDWQLGKNVKPAG